MIFESVARVVERIGPIKFEPMEKHPNPQPPLTADPAAEYRAAGDEPDEADAELGDAPEGPVPADPAPLAPDE